MNYQELNAILFAIYIMALCAAFLLSRRTTSRWEQVAAYTATIFVFNVLSNIDPLLLTIKHHYWWYFINAGVDVFIVALAWKLQAPASKWIMRIGYFAVFIDMSFFVGAGSGHKLPGPWYFFGSNVCESMQILSMVIFSGPVIPFVRTLSHAIARKFTWLWRHEQVIGHT